MAYYLVSPEKQAIHLISNDKTTKKATLSTVNVKITPCFMVETGEKC